MSVFTPNIQKYGIRIILLLSAFAVVFANLGGPYLWEDEACTAFLARNILKSGLPMASDGKNLISDSPDGRWQNAEGVWICSTWLPYYITAFSFFLGDFNQFYARLPFALAGFLCILVMPPVYRELKRSSNLHLLPSFLLVLSVPFLLHTRQCRYYSFAILFTLISVWGYLRIIHGKRGGGTLFTIFNILLFHSFYALLPLHLIGFGLHYLCLKIFCPEERHKKDSFKKFLPPLAIIVMFTLPFAFYAGYFSGSAPVEASFAKFFLFLKIYSLWINFFLCPILLAAILAWFLDFPALAISLFLLALAFGFSVHLENSFWGLSLFPLAVLFALALLIFKKFKGPSSSITMGWWSLPAIFCLIYPIFFSLAAPFPFYRYLVPMIPMAILIISACLESIWEKRKCLALLIVVLWVGSNLLAYTPAALFGPLFPRKGQQEKIYTLSPYQSFHWVELRFDFWEYLGEIWRPAADLNGLIINYLLEHGSSEDIVKASYGDYSLMFHTPFRVYNRFERGDEVPDWIILRKAYPFIKDGEYVNKIFRENKFETIGFHHKNIPWNDNRPDPLFHLYLPPVTSKLNPVIFRRTGERDEALRTSSQE